MGKEISAEEVDAAGGFDVYEAEYRIAFSVPHGTEDPERAFYAWLSSSDEAKIEFANAHAGWYWEIESRMPGIASERAWNEGGYLLESNGDEFPDISFD